MATGDSANMLERLKRLLPQGWFSESSPYKEAVLGSISDQLAKAYDLLSFAKAQTRISTATGFFLDLIAFDFFGLRFQRRVNEPDSSWSARIKAEILRPRVTRSAMVTALQNLTGNTPKIFEFRRPADTGGYSVGGVGYGVAGGYGSLQMPYQCFIDIQRASTKGIPYIGGYGTSALAYRTPSRSEYADLGDSGTTVGDAEIYSAIEDTKPVGTTAWVRIYS